MSGNGFDERRLDVWTGLEPFRTPRHKLAADRQVMNVGAVRAKASIDVVQAITLGEKVLERSRP